MKFQIDLDEKGTRYMLILPENQAEISQIKDLKAQIGSSDVATSDQYIEMCIEPDSEEDENLLDKITTLV